MEFSTLLAAATCPVPELPCATGVGLVGFRNTIANLVPYAASAFYAILFLMMMIYAINLIINSANDSAIDEARKAFVFALMGSFIVWFRIPIVDTFQVNGGALIDASGLSPAASAVRTYVTIVGAAVATGFVIVRAIRLAASNGDEGTLQTQRRLFLNSIFGVGMLVLAGSIVDAAFPGGEGILSEQLLGVLEYLMIILGGLAVLGIVVGAVMLILSYDEGLKDRAKQSIFASVIVLIVIACIGAVISIL